MGLFLIMSIRDVKLNDLVHKGNKPLTVGIAWSIFGITICPCPLCLLGSLSFLSIGIADKLNIGIFKNTRKLKEEHDTHCKKCHETK